VKDQVRKRFVGLQMEDVAARLYARQRGSGNQIEAYSKQALNFTRGVRKGADVLEVGSGPGYLAIEMARLRRVRVTGLDISRSFVAIANQNARQAAVKIDFRLGDAANMPFDSESFDLVVCQAAFKDFAEPGMALNEIHRVLRRGGTAAIQDMSGDATRSDLVKAVTSMELSWLGAFMTKWSLAMVRRRASSRAQFERLAAESAFLTCDIKTEGLSVEVRLKRAARP